VEIVALFAENTFTPAPKVLIVALCCLKSDHEGNAPRGRLLMQRRSRSRA
jgi:hypothetical protein